MNYNAIVSYYALHQINLYIPFESETSEYKSSNLIPQYFALH